VRSQSRRWWRGVLPRVPVTNEMVGFVVGGGDHVGKICVSWERMTDARCNFELTWGEKHTLWSWEVHRRDVKKGTEE